MATWPLSNWRAFSLHDSTRLDSCASGHAATTSALSLPERDSPVATSQALRSHERGAWDAAPRRGSGGPGRPRCRRPCERLTQGWARPLWGTSSATLALAGSRRPLAGSWREYFSLPQRKSPIA